MLRLKLVHVIMADTIGSANRIRISRHYVPMIDRPSQSRPPVQIYHWAKMLQSSPALNNSKSVVRAVTSPYNRCLMSALTFMTSRIPRVNLLNGAWTRTTFGCSTLSATVSSEHPSVNMATFQRARLHETGIHTAWTNMIAEYITAHAY